MKKLAVYILIAAMLVSVAACGKKEEPAAAPEKTEEAAPEEKEEEAPTESMANPITECASLEEVNKAVDGKLAKPAVMGVTDEAFETIDCKTYTIGQYRFNLNGVEYTYRFANGIVDDISGIYVDGKNLFRNEAVEYETAIGDGFLAARMCNMDGQYVLIAKQENGVPDMETFEGMAKELFSMATPDGNGGEEPVAGVDEPVPCASRAGTYTGEDSSVLDITDEGRVKMDIFRLCSMEGIVTGIDGDLLLMRLNDPNGGQMIMQFDPISKKATATDSHWDLIHNGDSFEFAKDYQPNGEAK